MNFNQIKNIIFDLGNVVINIDFDLTYKAFSKISTSDLETVHNKFTELQIWERYELGEFSNDEFIYLLRTELNTNVSDQEIIHAWNALLLDIPLARINKIKELSKKYRLFILSNTSDLHIIEVNKILENTCGISDLKNLVETAYYSHEMKLRKPAQEIYDFVIQESNLIKEETVFLDDNLDNILGAQNYGIKTIHVLEHDMCYYLKDA